MITAHAPLTLHPYQDVAVADLQNTLAENHSAQLIAACGVGKTLMLIAAAQARGVSDAVMFMPTLALISQQARVVARQYAGKVLMAAVCSDNTVFGKKAKTARLDAPTISDDEVGVEVLHNADEVAAWYAKYDKPGLPRFVFSTFASADDLIDAQHAGTAPVMDIALIDEAHHLAGPVGIRGERIKHKTDGRDRLRTAKRVYATATPKTASLKMHLQAEKAGRPLGDYMDDETIFGPVAHHLPFGDAIVADILVDYSVDVVTVSEKQLADLVGTYPGLDADDPITGRTLEVQEVVAREVIRRLHVEEGVDRFLTYQNSVARAKRFADILNESRGALGLPKAKNVNGKQKAVERTAIIDALSHEPDGMVLTNVQVMNEGVDSPALDAVVFIDPKHSAIDIMQCIGRVLRKADGKDTGRVIIIAIVPDEFETASTDAEREAILDKCEAFKPVFAVLRALQQHDVVVEEKMTAYRFTRQKPRIYTVRQADEEKIRVVGIDGLTTKQTRVLERSIHIVAARRPRSKNYLEWEAEHKRDSWIEDQIEEGFPYEHAAYWHDLKHEPWRSAVVAKFVLDDGMTAEAAESHASAEYDRMTALNHAYAAAQAA